MNRTTISKIVHSEAFPKVLVVVGAALGALIIFDAGVMVGRHELLFSAHWGDNYERNFGGPGMMDFDDHGPMANGAFGKVLQSASSTLLIATPMNQEERVVISDDTIIRDHQNTLSTTSLAAGTYVTVIGEPDDHGQIEAKLIRVMPAPMMASSTHSR